MTVITRQQKSLDSDESTVAVIRYLKQRVTVAPQSSDFSPRKKMKKKKLENTF